MEKFLNHIWGSAITAVVFLISIVFCYQILFNYEDLYLAILIAFILTLVVRYIIAILLNNIEVDFNSIREILVSFIGCLITYFIYKN